MKKKFGLNFFKPVESYSGNWSILEEKNRDWENMYRQRWSHDKVVRTTHGVNCTGSCSWKVFVKNGIITWENQQIDYPSCGPDMPEFEPRGCPRGATFSWYEYSPLRVSIRISEASYGGCGRRRSRSMTIMSMPGPAL